MAEGGKAVMQGGERDVTETVYWPKANKQKPTETKSQTISGQEAATTATAAKQRQKDGRINKYNDDETKWSVSHPHGQWQGQ